jgi:isopenicillin-N N-acyltransferase-like protein
MFRSRFVPALACLTCLLLTASVHAAEESRYEDGKHGKGELKHINGLPVLIVQGTPEEIGEQAAALTAKPLQTLISFPKDLVKKSGKEAAWPLIILAARQMEAQFPADHLKELKAAEKEAKIDHDLALLGNTFPDISKSAGCSSLIVGKERSDTGGPLFGRNLDYATLGTLQEYSLVTVYRPKGKHAFVSIGFPGMIGCLSGMNDAGLALAVHEVNRTKDDSPKLDTAGIPYTLAFRRLLEECTTVAEAEKLLRDMKRTTMLNLAVCDKNGGAIFEITTKNVVVRSAEDSLCTCTNHFCSSELGVGVRCDRLPKLDATRATKAKFKLADVAKSLHAVNQGDATLQTMIFEPAVLKLHLAIGKCPSSALPLKELDLAPLFTDKK